MCGFLQLRASRPASVTGVSHRFNTWRQARCSDNNLNPASPNWRVKKTKKKGHTFDIIDIIHLLDHLSLFVSFCGCLWSYKYCFVVFVYTCVDQRLSCLSEGSLMSCSAQALVTLVKARLRFSKFPKEPELKRRARSASYGILRKNIQYWNSKSSSVFSMLSSVIVVGQDRKKTLFLCSSEGIVISPWTLTAESVGWGLLFFANTDGKKRWRLNSRPCRKLFRQQMVCVSSCRHAAFTSYWRKGTWGF